MEKIEQNHTDHIKELKFFYDQKRLSTNKQTRTSILNSHFTFAIFFFFMLWITKDESLIFIALISLIIGRGIAYLFVKFLPITLSDLDDNYREIPDGKYKPYL